VEFEHAAAGGDVVAPRWNGAAYELARLEGLDAPYLRRGPMGIREPREAAPAVSPQAVRLWLIPGLAFTVRGDRLGYGGGWYDRLLGQADPSARRVGLAHPFQIVETLPVEPHDWRLTDVIF
jgi:5-formyltetrahydrofolate cyclo-ligase